MIGRLGRRCCVARTSGSVLEHVNERLRRGRGASSRSRPCCLRKDGKPDRRRVDRLADHRRRRRRHRRLRRSRATSASASARRRSRPDRRTCWSSSPAAPPCPTCSTAWRASSRSTATTCSPRSCCSIAMGCTCGTAPARACRQSYCEAIDGAAIGPQRRLVRDRRVSAASAFASRTSRPTRSGATTASWRSAGRAASLLVDADLRDRRRAARHVRALLPRAARARRRRRRARRARHARGRHRDRARPLRGGRARERGALPRPLRERERADRDRHDGREHHRGQRARSSACSATPAPS